MSTGWKSALRLDPLPALLTWRDSALSYFIQRDLLEHEVPPVQELWELPEARRLVEKQLPDGAWRYPGRRVNAAAGTNYNLLETYRSLRILVEMYDFSSQHPAIARAAAYVFSCQSDEGDIRGILGNQFMPYYHAALLELLIKAGYASDTRTLKGLHWLLSVRQEDGGWIVPAQQVPARQKTSRFWQDPPVPPDRSRPHSQLATGMVLRAFAAHPAFHRLPEVRHAGERLKERFFLADKYNDRKAASYWFKFQYPFWWPNLLTALDSLSWLGFTVRDGQVTRGLAWFQENQAGDGLWETGYGSGSKVMGMRRWVGLAVCRMLKRFYG